MKISNSDFVHLHNHSEYSSFDGLNKMSFFTSHAKKMGFKALALTDHGNMGGAIKFIQACGKEEKTKIKDENGKEIEVILNPIKPIVGAEFYLSKNRHVNFTEKKEGSKIIKGQTDKRKGNRHLVLIAKNWKGWQNLCTLSQLSWTEGHYIDPRIDLEILAKYSEGIICNSACLSSVVNANLLHDRYKEAKKAAGIFKDIFRDDFHLEVMYHGINAEAKIIPDIIKLSKDINAPVIATNDCHYCRKDQGLSQELLMCMSTSRCLHDPKRIHFPHHEFYMKSAEEMGKIFGSYPEFITNTVMVADKVDAQDILENMKAGMRLPAYNIPDNFESPYEYMKHLALEGMKKLGWDKSDAHMKRLNLEMEDVKVAWENNKYDFATYFLIVRDYIQEANNRKILTGCGRGSGYASVLLRALGIAYGPDPIEHDLIWERFLGFDWKHFIQEKDFFDEDVIIADVKPILEAKEDDRDVVDDPGGIDRY